MASKYSTTLSVMIVEDDEDLRLILKGVVGQFPVTIAEAGDGMEALEKLRAKPVDLLLTDLRMPRLDGISLVEIVHREEIVKSSILVTGFGSREEIKRAMIAGASDFIEKPFEHDVVVRRVEAALNMIKSRDQERAVAAAFRSIFELPSVLPEARFGVFSRSLQYVGGDFYDVFRSPNGNWNYFVADISGHDPRSSIALSALKALIRAVTLQGYDVRGAMGMLHELVETVLLEDQFLTAVHVEIDKKAGIIRCTNAAHPPPFIISRDGTVSVLKTGGDIVGHIKNVSYVFDERKLHARDRVFVCTDGVLEAFSNSNFEDKLAALASVCREASHLPIDRVPFHVMNVVGEITGPAQDDMLILAIEFASDSPFNFCCRKEIPSDKKEIDNFWKYLSEEIGPMLDSADLFALELVIREALTNAILHGNCCNPALLVICEFNIAHDEVRIKISDQGSGFDWRNRLDKLAKGGDLEPAIGGYGLRIYQEYMDGFAFEDNGATIVMTKKVKTR